MFRDHLALVMSLAVLAIAGAGYIFIGNAPTKLVFQSLVLGTAITNVVSWRRVAVEAMKSGVRESSDNIVIYIWLSNMILLMYFIYLIIFNQVDETGKDLLRSSPISLLFYCFFFINGSIAALAPVNSFGPKRPQVIHVTIAAFIGGAAAATFAVLGLLGLLQIPT